MSLDRFWVLAVPQNVKHIFYGTVFVFALITPSLSPLPSLEQVGFHISLSGKQLSHVCADNQAIFQSGPQIGDELSRDVVFQFFVPHLLPSMYGFFSFYFLQLYFSRLIFNEVASLCALSSPSYFQHLRTFKKLQRQKFLILS